MTVLLFFIFIFGLIVGSFLNVVILRLGTKKSALKGRSSCPHCKQSLAWYDLIPVLSFAFLKGKCRYCHKKISWQYPLVEVATGLLFLLIISSSPCVQGEVWVGDIVQFCLLLAVSSLLVIIFVYDLKHYLIPDKIIFPAIVVTLLYQISLQLMAYGRQLTVDGQQVAVSSKQFAVSSLTPLLAAIGVAVFFLALVLITHGKGMGVGDIKLAFLMGLLLSWPQIVTALFIAFLSGGLIGLVLILTHKKKFKSMVPFGPFLVSGTIIALFWGEKIVNFYWSILL